MYLTQLGYFLVIDITHIQTSAPCANRVHNFNKKTISLVLHGLSIFYEKLDYRKIGMSNKMIHTVDNIFKLRKMVASRD